MNSTTHIRHPIGVFSITHMVILAVSLSLAAFLAYFFSKKFGFNKKLIWVCAFIGLLCEIERLLFFVEETAGGGYRLPANLIPLNLCPFQVVFIFILALSEAPEKLKKLISFMYPAMVGGAFMGMLLCGEAFRAHGLSDLATYRYFIFHAMVVFFGLYLYLSRPIQFGLKSYGYGLLFTFFSVILGVWVNGFFGWDPAANHMFIVRPPVDGLPILNFRHGWPGYMLDMCILGFSMVTLIYLPVIISELRNLIRKR